MKSAAVSVLCCAVLALGCSDRTRTKKVLEPYAIVPGSPTAETGAPSVVRDPTAETAAFKVSIPHQCDLYQQLSVRKVDILWVVDSSGSMAPKQARLAANFTGFINQLVTANPPIDFHIGVVSTDTDDPASRGALHGWSLGALSGEYISCTPQTAGGTLCNTNPSTAGAVASAGTAFTQMSNVGTSGSPQERGLLAAYLALSNPANLSTASTERFIRGDAALYVVAVSDEDDSSCQPLLKQAICTADPGCRCAADNTLASPGNFGSTAYFTRFFETYKGYASADLVTFAAIVALDDGADAGVPSQFGEPTQHVGCCRSNNGQPCPTSGNNDGGFEVSYYGGRYLKVANDTGGVAVSICQSDFSGALASLGYSASGLRKEFRLTRGPETRPAAGLASGVELYVSPPSAANCQVSGNCPSGQVCRSGRCAKRVDAHLGATPNGAEYARCDGTALRNIIRFDGTAVPESLSTVEICYDVQANFPTNCP